MAVIGKCVFKHIKSHPLLINYSSGMEQSVQATVRCNCSKPCQVHCNFELRPHWSVTPVSGQLPSSVTILQNLERVQERKWKTFFWNNFLGFICILLKNYTCCCGYPFFHGLSKENWGFFIAGVQCGGWDVFSWWNQGDKPNQSPQAASYARIAGIIGANLFSLHIYYARRV